LKSIFLSAAALILVQSLSAQTASQPAAKPAAPASFVLTPENYHPFISEFQAQEQAIRQEAKVGTPSNTDDPWQWMLANIPWFECSNADFQQTYYFRWYAFQKHVYHAADGDQLSEFLSTGDTGGQGATVVDAAEHHLREARWLRSPKLANDYARFWLEPSNARNHNYSVALADAVNEVTLATGNTHLGTYLLSSMVDNYHAWERAQKDTNGLFWSVDTHDAMEVSISGDGYRPTLNSYMYADARAISRFANITGDRDLAGEFAQKADAQHKLIDTELWNANDRFYEVISPAKDSPIRQDRKFKDNGTALKISGVRELIGYIPWYFNIPAADRDDAWKQLFDPKGFNGLYGPTTAERRSPRYRFETNDKCPWNGPTWAFATTQTLVAMANVLNRGDQHVVSNHDYYQLFSNYVHAQRLQMKNGTIIPWTDEAQDPDTGEWITREHLITKQSPQQGRGAYYNHSGFADPLITGLLGLRPSQDNLLIINPLLPANEWSYFAIDGLPYHGHLLTLLYDPTGERYHHGKGMTLLVDGKHAVSRPNFGPLFYTIK